MASQTAAQTVLAIPELLSEILIHLPFSSTLRSRRVNKTWMGVIDTCPTILWNTWRSPYPPGSLTKQILQDQTATTVTIEPLDAFFSKTLINCDEWTTGTKPNEPPAHIVQKKFILNSLKGFLGKYSENLEPFYITRPPLKKIASCVTLVIAGKASVRTTFVQGFTVEDENGITVDSYLKAFLNSLEASWGSIAEELPSTGNTSLYSKYIAQEGPVKKEHRLVTQALSFNEDKLDVENGVAMQSTLVIVVQVKQSFEKATVSSDMVAQKTYGRGTSWWRAISGAFAF